MRAGGAPAGKGKEEAKPAAKPGAKPARPATRTEAPDLNKALLEQQKTLDKLLKKQNEALRSQDVSTKQALEDSRQLLRDMEADACWPGARPTPRPSTWAALRGWPPRSSRRCWVRTPMWTP